VCGDGGGGGVSTCPHLATRGQREAEAAAQKQAEEFQESLKKKELGVHTPRRTRPPARLSDR
jgi:hypothetical protein